MHRVWKQLKPQRQFGAFRYLLGAFGYDGGAFRYLRGAFGYEASTDNWSEGAVAQRIRGLFLSHPLRFLP